MRLLLRRCALWLEMSLLVVSLVSAAAAADSVYANFDPETQTWAVGNRWIEAQFHLEPSGAFRHMSLADKLTGRVWRAPVSELSSPLHLTVDQTSIDETTLYSLLDQSAAQIEPNGVRQTILLSPKGLAAQIRFEAEVYRDQPFLRYRAFYKNTGGGASLVTQADMLAWKFDTEDRNLLGFFVGQWSAAGTRANFETHEVDLSLPNRAVDTFTGAYGDHATWLAIRDSQDDGIAFGWEFDGRARAHAVQRADGVLKVQCLIESLHHPVDPGGEFAVPGAFLGVYHGDWDEAGYRTQRFAEAVLAARNPDPENFPYVMFNSWGYQWDINETVLRQAAERAAQLGAEVFTVDFGWAPNTGNWRPDPVKFPSGLRSLSDYVHSLGMKFGLHLPFAEAMADSRVLMANPDWAALNQAEARYFDAEGLCLAHKPVQEWVIREIVRVVRRYGVDWIVQDGENMVKECTATNHTHHPQDSNYSNSVLGLNEVVAAVQKEIPELIWENCEDGGNMQTFNMVQRYTTSILNDNSDPLTTRQAIYGATFPFPPRYTDRYMEATPWNTYATRSHFFGGPLIVMDKITEWPDWMTDFVKKEVAVYKSIRVPIRDGKVYHLTPRPDGTFNDSIQSHHQATDRSVILVFRQESDADHEIIKPRGLDSGRTYRVRFQESPQSYTATGQELMETGVRVDLPELEFAEVVYIDPAAEAGTR